MTELEKIMQALRARPLPEGTSWQVTRAAMEIMQQGLALPSDVALQSLDAGGVPAEWIGVPKSSPERVLLYFHGGGYAIGSIATHRHLMQRLARAARARVLGIGYRLAPEHPFPAAIDDARASYGFLLAQGIGPGQVAIGGDSAGGGLTLALLLALRDAGEPLPACAICLSPWTDLSGSGDSITTRAAADPMVSWAGLRRFADAYLGTADPKHPLASPLFADLFGLPPLYLQVGNAEVLLDDSTRLAERARSAGVDVTLEVWDDMIHVFQAFPSLAESEEAIARLGAFVAERTGGAKARGARERRSSHGLSS